MSAVETGQVFVGGKKNLLGQILSVERVADRFQADEIDQILILFQQIFQIFFL